MAQNQNIGLGYGFGFNPGSDTFTYGGDSVGNYTLGWYSITGSAEARLSGYGGIRFFTESLPRMAILKDGNVGIGTTSPYSKLHVEGRTRVGRNGTLHLDWTNQSNWGGHSGKWAGHIGFNAFRNNDDPKDYFYGSNRYTGKGVFEGSNHGFRWLFRNSVNHDSDGQHLLTEYMRLTNSGRLGIGTTVPDAMLTVKGDIHAEEVKVDLSVPVPDYVFKEDYPLKSLQEVQDYIEQYGHLPNIPSAKEMEAQGIDLGTMNMKLLEKIEELTLYVLKQEMQLKETADLKARMETLEKRLQKLERTSN